MSWRAQSSSPAGLRLSRQKQIKIACQLRFGCVTSPLPLKWDWWRGKCRQISAGNLKIMSKKVQHFAEYKGNCFEAQPAKPIVDVKLWLKFRRETFDISTIFLMTYCLFFSLSMETGNYATIVRQIRWPVGTIQWQIVHSTISYRWRNGDRRINCVTKP